ncbi:LysR family transcriptional regulator [Chelativorans sp. M5D2P16]|uniref:LysR family transcriptional regulator n=1 Tax=Chelativorans sp. M5D2P16 TaxID=3095678 RepID=UPI002ACAFC38|nr:LysR family transcriptional regulator [Chelativorans sp. M5D2P16]MDZ5695982.1 LysR substrate-binding domain-containing protein [Chelativorans sp. M5D2P16]
MDTKWLEDFLALAQTRNFSRASEERNVTQPAFSRRIRALESWLGVSLFDRRTYPVTLTTEGRAFRETAENIVATLYADRAQFQERLHVNRPDLRIAAATTLNLNFIPDWLHGLEGETGHLTTHIFTQNFHDMFHDLAEGEIDLVLQYAHADVPLLFEASRFDTRVLACEPMILVSPADERGQPLHDPSRAGCDMALPYMGYSPDGYFAEVEKLLFARRQKDGPMMRRLGESPTSEVLKRMAVRYGALTLLPESCARDVLQRGEMLCVGGPDWQVQLEIRLYRSRDSRRAAVRKLWAALNRPARGEPQYPAYEERQA